MRASGRTVTENARRSQIVRAAIETIGELGYAKASFGQIAKRAGLSSTGMISYHFNGKADLVRELVQQVLAASVVHMGARIEAAPDPAAKLTAYITSNLEFIAQHPAEITAMLDILQHSRAGHPETEGLDSWHGDAIDVLAGLLRTGQRSGAFRDFDPRVMAITVRQAIDGLPTELIAHPGTAIDAYASELVLTFALATRATS
jgi:AcrR family transcriptional regulator